MATPWMTSDDLIESVKRKIAFPISQSTFEPTDILAFANEEMFISQVPSVLEYHEEFFVSYKIIPLTTGVNRYAIPDRAIGMRLRDVKWQDNQGNMFDMTRIAPEDKAFFQRNIGANEAIHKFYVEGNDIVLSPSVTADPSGQLVMSFYLRPNQLVTNDRAAIIQHFSQDFTINNATLVPGDNLKIQTVLTISVLPPVGNPPYQSYLPGSITTVIKEIATVTAVASATVAITDIEPGSGIATITAAGHNLSSGQTVVITGTDSTPSIDGTYVATVSDPNTFTIQTMITGAGTTGSFTSPQQFLIGISSIATAANMATALKSLTGVVFNAINSNTNIVHMQFDNILFSFKSSNPTGISFPANTQGCDCISIPTVIQDGSSIDFLQTKPGHRIFSYDVIVPAGGVSGNTLYFNLVDIPVPNQYNGIGLSPGDYVCLSNEAIIPQIPPDLHTGLAERTSARILASLGDQAGLQAANQKIQEIDNRQGTILDDRVEGTPQKVTARHSILRYGKMGVRRRT